MLIRAVGALDVLASLLCDLMDRSSKHDKYTDFVKHLERETSPSRLVSRELRGVFRKHEAWIGQLRDLRNKIVHDGEFDGFRGVGHQRAQVLDATVCGVRAGAFAISTWRGLRMLTDDVAQFVETLYRPPKTTE